MAGQMVTLTLMTTADSGVPADWARAGGAARAPASNAARASLRIVFRIASLHHQDRTPHRLFNIHAMQSAQSAIRCDDWPDEASLVLEEWQ